MDGQVIQLAFGCHFPALLLPNYICWQVIKLVELANLASTAAGRLTARSVTIHFDKLDSCSSLSFTRFTQTRDVSYAAFVTSSYVASLRWLFRGILAWTTRSIDGATMELHHEVCLLA